MNGIRPVSYTHLDVYKRQKQVYQMLVWMTEGYMHEKLSCQETLNLENIMKDFEEWKVMFKKMAYKKE